MGSVCGLGPAAAGEQVSWDLTRRCLFLPWSVDRHRLWLVGSFMILSAVCLGIILIAYVKKPKDGGFQPVCSRPPSGASSESLEPQEESE